MYKAVGVKTIGECFRVCRKDAPKSRLFGVTMGKPQSKKAIKSGKLKYVKSGSGFECWCAPFGSFRKTTTESKYGLPAACGVPCIGDKRQVCGGPTASSVYRMSLYVPRPFGEVGGAEINDQWQRIQFPRYFANPVVFLGVPSFRSKGIAVARVANVTHEGFLARLQAPSCEPPHVEPEMVPWLVVEEGLWALEAGQTLFAGITVVDPWSNHMDVALTDLLSSMDSKFRYQPTAKLGLFSQTLNASDDLFMTTRHHTITENNGFMIALETEGREQHPRMPVSWLAVEDGASSAAGVPLDISVIYDPRSLAVGFPHVTMDLLPPVKFPQTPMLFGQYDMIYAGCDADLRMGQWETENKVQLNVEEETCHKTKTKQGHKVTAENKLSVLAFGAQGSVSGRKPGECTRLDLLGTLGEGFQVPDTPQPTLEDPGRVPNLEPLQVICAEGHAPPYGEEGASVESVSCDYSGLWRLDDFMMECHPLCGGPPLDGGLPLNESLYKFESEGDQHTANGVVTCAEGAATLNGSESSKITCEDGNWTHVKLECLMRASGNFQPNGGVYFPDEVFR
jgi:hypothetical protein